MGIKGRVVRLHSRSVADESSDNSLKAKGKKRFSFKFSLSYLLILVGIIFVGSFFIQNIAKSVIDSIGLYSENKVLEARIDDLYYEKFQLIEQQENLLVDASVEREAKEKLGLIKPGEDILVLVDINE